MQALKTDLQQVVEQLEGQLDLAQKELLEYARDLRKLVDMEREKSRLLEQSHFVALRRLANICELRDNDTGQHIKRISSYVRYIADQMQLPDNQVDILARASCLHDLGKIAVPDRVLLKQGKLDDDEWQVMRRHPEFGASLLEGDNSPLMEVAREISLTHHEKFDGTGYPYGLRSNHISIAGRITMVADVYDALRSDRPYKRGFSHEQTSQIILEGDGRTSPTDFDPELLGIFQLNHERFNDIYEQDTQDVLSVGVISN